MCKYVLHINCVKCYKLCIIIVNLYSDYLF